MLPVVVYQMLFYNYFFYLKLSPKKVQLEHLLKLIFQKVFCRYELVDPIFHHGI